MDLSDPRVFLVCAAVITAFHSVMVTVFQWVWLGSLGKLGEVIEVHAAAPGEPRHVEVLAGGIRMRGIDPGNVEKGERILAFIRPENIEVLPDQTERDGPNFVRGRVDQIIFEGPTVRLVVDANGTAIKATAGGIGRLTLLDKEHREVLLRLQDVTVVRDDPALAA